MDIFLIIGIFFVFGFGAGLFYGYITFRPTRRDAAKAAEKEVKKVLKELKMK